METLFQKTFVELLAESEVIMQAAIDEYKPSKVFALFSGGDDSRAACTFASRHPAFTGVLHINTGIGIPETNQYVRDTCHQMRWPLIELHPTDRGYDVWVLAHGFPGPAAHKYCYVLLKERALNWFVSNVAKNATHDRILLVTGVRLQESARRMGNVEKFTRDGCKVWCAPLLYWSKLDCLRLAEEAGVPRNPVVELLHMSGECLCGSFAENETTNELQEIKLWYPHVYQRINALQAQARERGVHAKWGERPPTESVYLSDADLPLLSMCQQCDGALTA